MLNGIRKVALRNFSADGVPDFFVSSDLLGPLADMELDLDALVVFNRFVRRALFNQLGGFPNQPILEDVAFCERLIPVTTPFLLSPPVITDARKFSKMGVWKIFLRIFLIIPHVEFRLPILPRVFFQEVR